MLGLNSWTYLEVTFSEKTPPKWHSQNFPIIIRFTWYSYVRGYERIVTYPGVEKQPRGLELLPGWVRAPTASRGPSTGARTDI